ncbi:hypothetical protein, partial [Salmonella enterica]
DRIIVLTATPIEIINSFDKNLNSESFLCESRILINLFSLRFDGVIPSGNVCISFLNALLIFLKFVIR